MSYYCYLLILALLSSFSARAVHGYVEVKPSISSPPLADKPFIVTWNVASQRCEEKFGIKLDLDKFDIVHNPDKSWRGSTLTIFYSDQLGQYPQLLDNGTALYGGIPQSGDLYAHLDKAAKDIMEAIPEKDFQGLAVIDWESWHPLFDRMSFGAFLKYQQESIKKVAKQHPEWTHEEQVAEAKIEYEAAARAYFDYTLALGKILRPRALWGFYLYPDCYNYDKTGQNLTCREQVLEMNDEIQWVFDDSTALYPSVYLGEWFKNKNSTVAYVANRIEEAMRVDGDRPGDISIPVFAYHSVTYRKVPEPVNLFDLRNSIGVASVLGASGMVIWGDYDIADSPETCQILSNYIDYPFGPYCKQTTDEASRCSRRHCNKNGRCVVATTKPQANKESTEMSTNLRYLNAAEALELVHSLPNAAYKVYSFGFYGEDAGADYSIVCQCFRHWKGKHCQIPNM